jgi:hypothetical protein
MPFLEISGAVPNTLGDVVTIPFGLPVVPRNGVGILFYMVDTREGNRVYRIDMNGQPFSQIALPIGDYFATLHTSVGQLGRVNNLQFESIGPSVPPLDILNIVLFYED